MIADRFELLSVAGTGASGAVWRARDRHGATDVALKLLGETGAIGVERFAREAHVLAELRHPAIVRFVGSGTTSEGRGWTALEWLDGQDLSRRLASGEPLGLRESVDLGRRVAEALAAAHARGVVHRDIKPTNLFLVGNRPEAVKVLDFGIARFATMRGDITRTGALVGTPGYMAPEQVRGEGVGPAADIFALGCVLYECLVGRPAFVAEQPLALLFKIVAEEVEAPSLARPDVPAELDELIAEMCTKHLRARIGDARTVAERLIEIGRELRRDPGARTSHPGRLSSIGGAERRVVTLVGAGRVEPASAADEVAARFGARREVLADGEVLLVFAGTGQAVDQAARAVRAARALAGPSPVAVVTGRAEVGDRAPVGPLIDALIELLRTGAPGEVATDPTTAGLLDERFAPRTPLVGRTREMMVLRALWDECAGESVARAALITGPAGIGKSRVCRELIAEIEANGSGAVWSASVDPIASGSPLAPIAAVVRRAAGILDGEPVPAVRAKIAAFAASVVAPERERVAEFIGELLGVPLADEPSAAVRAARADAVQLGDQMRRAVEDLVDARAAERPLVLVLEGLQWADVPTVQLVDRILRNLSHRPLFVLGVARTEVYEAFPSLWRERAVAEVRLGPLAKKAAEQLARAALGAAATEPQVREVVERAEGHPFLLEELARAVVEGRLGSGLPETVIAVVQARLEALEPEARRVLRAASVLGQTFWRGALETLLGGARATDLDGWLDVLAEREIVARRPQARFPDESEWFFRQTLVRDGAYGMLTESDRALAHRLAGTWLESAGEPDAAVLASHYVLGGERERASRSLLRAAQDALAAGDTARALEHARAAARDARGEALGRARLLETESHTWRHESREAEAPARAAAEIFPAGSIEWATAMRFLTMSLVSQGKFADVERSARLLLATPPLPGAEVERVQMLARVAQGCVLASHNALAREILEQAERELRATQTHDDVTAGAIRSARAFVALGVADAGTIIEELSEAIACAGRIGAERWAANDLPNLAFIKSLIGLYEEAERDARRALQIAERLGAQRIINSAHNNLGLILHGLGRLDEAREVETRALDGIGKMGDRRLTGAAHLYLARIERTAKALDRALAHVDAALESFGGLRGAEHQALAEKTRILLDLGRTQDALAAGEATMRSMEHVEEMVISGCEAARLAHALALHAAGRTDDARRAIADARDKLLARASGIRNPAWKRSYLDRVPDHRTTLTLAREWGA